jgi:hypothetical protein
LFLTATITQQGIKEVQKILGVKHLEVIGIRTNVNDNIALTIRHRPASSGGENSVQKSFEACIKPVLMELSSNPENFPLTIVYATLKWCGYGVSVARRLLQENIYDGLDVPQNSRVVQFHAPQSAEVRCHK